MPAPGRTEPRLRTSALADPGPPRGPVADRLGLGDAGAHLSFLCDAGFGLHLLGHWGRERGDLLGPREAIRDERPEVDLVGARELAALPQPLLKRRRARLAVLGRGYAIVRKEQGQVVRQVGQVQPGDRLRVRVSDGEFGASVETGEGS